jgi:hypothetical protein
MKLQHVFVIKTVAFIMLLNTFEMCCMETSVLCFILCNTEVFFQGVINQFENEEGSDTILG